MPAWQKRANAAERNCLAARHFRTVASSARQTEKGHGEADACMAETCQCRREKLSRGETFSHHGELGAADKPSGSEVVAEPQAAAQPMLCNVVTCFSARPGCALVTRVDDVITAPLGPSCGAVHLRSLGSRPKVGENRRERCLVI
jgi:hypothetical protein